MIYNFEELTFGVLIVDRFHHREGLFLVESRPFAAFSYRVSGTGVFEVGNKRVISRPGDILFLPANMPYRVDYSVGESIVVHFTHCNYMELENIRCDNAAIELYFQRLLEIWNERRSVNGAKAVIYEILEALESHQKLAMENTVFSDCVRCMETGFQDPTLDVQAVCDRFFISASGLQRAFSACFGVSPKQYLTRLRMNRALELLAQGRLSVKEIAFACGFADEKYFSRAFKKKYGHPPSHFYKKLVDRKINVETP
ncbi:MAG: AraC family transcriptional regulator [Clostridia bacterium]|nr:AraC family transcriptional regulator [Clostridia bacterium]